MTALRGSDTTIIETPKQTVRYRCMTRTSLCSSSGFAAAGYRVIIWGIEHGSTHGDRKARHPDGLSRHDHQTPELLVEPSHRSPLIAGTADFS